FREDDAHRRVATRQRQGVTSVEELALRSQLNRRAMELLADAGALRGLAGHRHQARWAVAGVQEPLPLFTEAPLQAEQCVALPLFTEAPVQAEQGVALPLPSVGENLMADYALVGTTLGPHLLRLLRSKLKARGCRSSKQLKQMNDNTHVKVAGLVTGRQRPGT